MKRVLQDMLSQARGIHVLPLVLARVSDMSEEEARQWVVLLRNLQEDAGR